MAFKFALIAAAAASRIARQADSENEKLIKECQVSKEQDFKNFFLYSNINIK